MKVDKSQLIKAARVAVGGQHPEFWQAVDAEIARLQPKVEPRKRK